MTARKVTRRAILTEEDLETARILGTYLLCESNATAAAEALGIDRRTVRRHVDRAPRRGLEGTAPAPLPPGRSVERMTEEHVHNPETGEWVPTRTWVKSKSDAAGEIDPETFADLARAALEDAAGHAGTIRAPVAPADVMGDLVTVEPWADLHLGRKSWRLQTGQDWDLSLAAAAYRETSAEVLGALQPAGEGILLGLGDLTEADDDDDATPASGHKQDVDTRHEKTAREALSLILWKVAAMRARFARVRVVILPGNHDERTARMIRVFLALLFEGDDQVTVEDAPTVFWFYGFGVNYLAAHHGHIVRHAAQLVGKMATERRDLWGACSHRFGFMGHLHHEWAKEEWDTRVEGFRSPAARNRYDAGSPWASGRTLQGLTFHRTLGLRGRVIRDIPSILGVSTA